MIVLVLVLAIALLLAAGVLLLTDRARRRAVDIVRRMRNERDDRFRQVEADRDAAQAERDSAVSERDDAVSRADKLEAEAATRAAPAAAGDGSPLEGLWALTMLRTDWSRRRAGSLSTAPDAEEDQDPLTRVLTTEVEQLRDDAGIPGSLRVSLTPPAAPEEAVLVAASITTLLGALARWCDAYDLFVHRWEGRVAAVMVCDGFNGPDTVADETGELLAALSPASGDLDVDRDPEGRLRARLSLPAAS